MKRYFWPFLILALFLFTRFYKIASIPGSVYWDEASIGYNAFAVATDLKDEWGEFLPLHFRAFGEFKLPVYVYAVTPFVKLLGLSALTVRLPAVLFSLGTVTLIYFLTLKLTKDKLSALLASFYLTTSPWFFIFSRTGYEATAGLLFFLLGIYFFILSLEKKYFFLFSAISYLVAIYSYNSLRLIVPLVFFLQSALVYKSHAKFFLASLLLFGISSVPIARLFYLDAGGSRFLAVGETNIGEIIQNYLSHFNPQFLLEGDINPRSTQPGWGVLWPWDLILLPMGIYALVQKEKKLFLLFLAGFFLSFLPASLTREAPHALRSLSAVPFMALFWALGLSLLINKLPRYKTPLLALILFLSLSFFANYWWVFTTTYNQRTASDWQYEYKETFSHSFASQEEVTVSDRYGQPYIFALFYLEYPPEKFRQEVNYNPPSDWGFSTVASFGNFKFVK